MEARKISESGFYHVVTKGEADQLLFFDDADREAYVGLLAETRDAYELRLHAYCLMSNHTHLLVEDPKRQLSAAMKHLNERFANRFKERTGRTGHVFKNRFWSEPVEDDAYLLCAMRYIHANPAAAGICKASAYPWSSVRDYLGRTGITDTSMLLGMLGGRDGFIEFSKKEPPTALAFPGSKLKGHLTQDELETIAEQIVGPLEEVRSMGREKKRDAARLLGAGGFTVRAIAQLIGASTKTVSRMLA